MAPPGTPAAPAQLGSSPCLVRGRRGGGWKGLWLEGAGLWEVQLWGEQGWGTGASCPDDSLAPAHSRHSMLD